MQAELCDQDTSCLVRQVMLTAKHGLTHVQSSQFYPSLQRRECLGLVVSTVEGSTQNGRQRVAARTELRASSVDACLVLVLLGVLPSAELLVSCAVADDTLRADRMHPAYSLRLNLGSFARMVRQAEIVVVILLGKR
jgi:hypothetical protein